MNRSLPTFAVLLLSGIALCDDVGSGKPAPDASAERIRPQLKKQLFQGKVVLLRDALSKREIKSYDEFDNLVALEMDNGELLPIIPDWRGRAFFQDKRLRNRKVDLIGYRRPEAPLLQILMVFTFDEKGQRQYTDYWCDICSIPMYEIKPCECCQADIRLRFQPQALPKAFRNSESKDGAAVR